MKISPDQYIIWKIGFIEINSTILFTWIVMAILIGFALILRLRLNREKTLGGLQSFFEAVIIMLENQVKDAGFKNMKFIFPVIATLFLFVFTYIQSNGNTKNTVICEITSIVFSETFARPNGIIIRNTPIIIHPKKLRSLIRENA